MIPAMVKFGKECKVAAGGEDVSKFDKGAYTGEISAAQLADVGAKYCIVGHSERRQYHGEDDMLVNAKAKALLAKGITPIICVGESLEQREMDLTMEYVAYQVKAALSGIGSMNAKNAQELLACPDIDGGLIGGASLKPVDFSVIVKATDQD